MDIWKVNELTTVLHDLSQNDPTQQVRDAASKALNKLRRSNMYIDNLISVAQNTATPQNQVEAIKDIYDILFQQGLNIL